MHSSQLKLSLIISFCLECSVVFAQVPLTEQLVRFDEDKASIQLDGFLVEADHDAEHEDDGGGDGEDNGDGGDEGERYGADMGEAFVTTEETKGNPEDGKGE